MDNEKPFKCPKCVLCFATSDHLVVHQRMHANNEKSNHDLLVKIPGTSSDHATDQTPTPTRFVKIADVEGSVLFEDINPFDQDFKLASKRPIHDQTQSHNASPISSTSTVNDVCPSQGNTMKLLYKKTGTPSKLAKTNSDSETEVSSTVSLEGLGLSNIACAIQAAQLKAASKERSILDQNEITSSTCENQSDVSVKKCRVTSKPEIKVKTFSNCKEDATFPSTSSFSSTVEEAVVRNASTSSSPLTSVSASVSATTIETVSATNVTTSPSSQANVSSTIEQQQNAETSLQSLLQQLQKETTDATVKPVANSATQSQEALREQLKSLIKSGQIKIKFTSDPSSPKVQATIVGNIAKKAVLTSRPTMVQDIVTTRPTMVQSISTARPTMVQEIQPTPRKREEIVQKDNLSQNSNISPQKTLIIKDKEQLADTHGSPTQVLPRLQKVPATIQIIPKPIYQTIAPKTSSDSSNSVSVSQKTALTAADVLTVSTNLSPVQSASSLVFAKQKLKHAIQHKSEDASVNGHISMIASGGSQKKYKNIVLDMYHTSITNGNATNMAITTTTADNITSFDSEDNDNEYSNKRKLAFYEDHSGDEKRKRFLERNRAAASRCRQKRKVWVSQLESKSDNLIKTNTLLMNEVNALRSEVVQLKSLLLAHKDCPVTKQQKALLGQMTPGSYIAAVSDGQIIAIHQIPEGTNGQETKSAEEVASSALTDMAARATQELESNIMASSVTVQSDIAISSA